MERYDTLPEIALEWHRDGRGAALATVVETWGSAPRPAGSQLVISGAGEIMGSVSGGCVEGAVVAEALDALADGAPRLLRYGVSDDDAFAVGLACGGTIRVLVEPVGGDAGGMPEALLADLVAARAARRAVAMVIDLATWERRLTAGPGDPLEGAIAARMRADRSGTEPGAGSGTEPGTESGTESGTEPGTGAGGALFVAVHNPPLHMAIVGAVHIAQALVGMARACGYDILVIDPREAFGAAARFPGERIVNDWPDEALAAFGLDARTAVITLSHDPKLDDPAIRAALAAPVFYLGCLGSPRTHAKRAARLAAAGHSEAEIARIHAPVGLAIGARSPAEIAVAIMAELTQALRQRR